MVSRTIASITRAVSLSGRRAAVYPGFLQLSGFMAMNFDRHVNAHIDMFNHLVEGDGDSAEKHREFYDEYLAVMDLTAEYYLQTVETVFVEHLLPDGKMTHRGQYIDLAAIKRDGADDGRGREGRHFRPRPDQAAQDLCTSIPPKLKLHHEQADVGHYGVFNGSRFPQKSSPRIFASFRRAWRRSRPAPVLFALIVAMQR